MVYVMCDVFDGTICVLVYYVSWDDKNQQQQ